MVVYLTGFGTIEMKFDFNLGNKKPNKNELIKIFLILSVIIFGLSKCSGISENGLWELLDEFQRKFFPQGSINELIIKDPELLNRRIKRDVDGAIRKVIPEYDRIIREADNRIKPRFLEEINNESMCYTEECKSLSPPIRMCSPVVEGIDCQLESGTEG